MKYLLLYFVAPAAVSFLIQSILCRKAEKRILRHGGLVLPTVSVVFGVITLFTQCGDVFGGLGVLEAVLWFVSAFCSVMGYGAAWLVFLIAKRKNGSVGKA